MLEDVSRENSIGGLRSGSSLARPQPKPSPCPADRSAATHAVLQNAPLPLARLRAVCNEQPHSSQNAGQRSNLLTHSNTSSPSSAADLTHTHAGTPLTQRSPIPVFHTQSTPFKRRLPTRTHRDQRRAGHHRAHKVPTGRAPTAPARHGTTGSYCGAGGIERARPQRGAHGLPVPEVPVSEPPPAVCRGAGEARRGIRAAGSAPRSPRWSRL